MRIKIESKNAVEIEEVVKGRAHTRYPYYRDLVRMVEEAEEFLRPVPKKERRGVRRIYFNYGTISSGYYRKGTPEATKVTIERGCSAWYLVESERKCYYKPSDDYVLNEKLKIYYLPSKVTWAK